MKKKNLKEVQASYKTGAAVADPVDTGAVPPGKGPEAGDHADHPHVSPTEVKPTRPEMIAAAVDKMSKMSDDEIKEVLDTYLGPEGSSKDAKNSKMQHPRTTNSGEKFISTSPTSVKPVSEGDEKLARDNDDDDDDDRFDFSFGEEDEDPASSEEKPGVHGSDEEMKEEDDMAAVRAAKDKKGGKDDEEEMHEADDKKDEFDGDGDDADKDEKKGEMYGEEDDKDGDDKMAALRAMKDKKDSGKEEVKEEDDKDDDEKKDGEDKKDDEAKYESVRVSRKSLNITEDVRAMFKGQQLSEDFKKRATEIIESVVVAKVNEQAKKMRRIVENDVKRRASGKLRKLAERLDSYLGYVVEQWMKENQLAIDNGLRAELTEEFIAGLKTLFQEHYIAVPDGKQDVITALTKKNEELTESLNREIKANADAKQTVEKMQREEIFAKVTGGLTAVQAAKLKPIAEAMTYEGPDQFKGKVKELRESYFPTTKPKPGPQTLEEATGLDPEEETASGVMGVYERAIARTAKK